MALPALFITDAGEQLHLTGGVLQAEFPRTDVVGLIDPEAQHILMNSVCIPLVLECHLL